MAHRWVPAKDTHGTPVPEREGRDWPDTSSTRRPPTNDIMTEASIVSTLFSETSAVTHLESYNVGSTVQQCRLGLLQDSDFAGDLEDSK